MSREIKFRIWEKLANKWWSRIAYYPPTFSNGGYSIYPDRGDTLQQFTGLKDKNGKEIYEGDIVFKYFKRYKTIPLENNVYELDTQNPLFDLDIITQKGEVKWNDEFCSFSLFHEKGYSHISQTNDSFEILGNIYENPELCAK